MTPEEKKEYMKEYRQRNKDKLRQQKKEYEERKKKDEKYQSKIREYKRVWANEHYDPEKSAEYWAFGFVEKRIVEPLVAAFA